MLVQQASQLYRWCGEPPASAGQLQSKGLFCCLTASGNLFARSRSASKLMSEAHGASSAPHPQEDGDVYPADVALHCAKCILEMELLCGAACVEAKALSAPPPHRSSAAPVWFNINSGTVLTFLGPFCIPALAILNPIPGYALLSIRTNPSWSSLSNAICNDLGNVSGWRFFWPVRLPQANHIPPRRLQICIRKQHQSICFKCWATKKGLKCLFQKSGFWNTYL